MVIISALMLLLKDTVSLYPLLTKGVMWLLGTVSSSFSVSNHPCLLSTHNIRAFLFLIVNIIRVCGEKSNKRLNFYVMSFLSFEKSDKFMTLKRNEAEKVLEIYRLFVRETDALISFYEIAKEFARNLPSIQKVFFE